MTSQYKTEAQRNKERRMKCTHCLMGCPTCINYKHPGSDTYNWLEELNNG